MFHDLTFMEILAKGGVAVMVLGLFSVISLGIMFERAIAFYSFKSRLLKSFAALGLAIKESGAAAAAEVSRNLPSPLSNVFRAGYVKRKSGGDDMPREEVLQAMELSARAEVAALEKYLGVLGTIGSTSPFVGLFGTVIGIIRAFSSLAAETARAPLAVADGVAEALVATAAGLFVAIPAVIAYNTFVRLVRKRSLELETMASEFTELIIRGEDGVEPGE